MKNVWCQRGGAQREETPRGHGNRTVGAQNGHDQTRQVVVLENACPLPSNSRRGYGGRTYQSGNGTRECMLLRTLRVRESRARQAQSVGLTYKLCAYFCVVCRRGSSPYKAQAQPLLLRAPLCCLSIRPSLAPTHTHTQAHTHAYRAAELRAAFILSCTVLLPTCFGGPLRGPRFGPLRASSGLLRPVTR